MKKLLILLVLCTPLVCAAQIRTIPLKRELILGALFCKSKDASLKIADAFAHKGSDTAARIYLEYEKTEVCEQKVLTVTLDTRVHRVEGEHGALEVYQGAMKTIVFIGLREVVKWETIFVTVPSKSEAPGCVPSQWTVCV